MSTSPKSPTAKMQLPLARKLRKFVRNWRKLQLPTSDPTSAKVITTTISPLLTVPVVGTCHTPPLTFPASPRSGRSDTSFLLSPGMEKSTSASSAGVITEPLTTLEDGESSEQTGSQESESQGMDNEVSLEELSSSGSPEPPAVPSKHSEPEVPDPFLVDDSDSEEDLDTEEDPPVSDVNSFPAHPSESTSITPPTADINKAVPSPESNNDEEEEAPDLYLQELVMPTMFLPIPNVCLPLPFSHLFWWLSPERSKIKFPAMYTRYIS